MTAAPPFTTHVHLAEVLELRRSLCARYGGEPEPIDAGLVEAALARARSTHYRTLCEQAAALLQSFATQRAFRDGNARLAFAVASVFLRLNGLQVRVKPAEALHFMREHVLARGANVPRIARGLERVCVPL